MFDLENVRGHKITDLGNGLELWLINIEDLKEQDVNARYMKADMFERLTQNIKKDNRLESFPFCALTDNGIEIVSGHHRVRASRAAGIYDIYIILDVTGLSRDRIKAKQLAHNSIDGYDNEELVKRIYDSITDAESQLEAFVPENIIEQFKKVSVSDVNVDMDIKQVQLMFFSYELGVFKKVIENIANNDDDAELYASELKNFEPFQKLMKETGKEYNVRALGTVLSILCERFLPRYGSDIPDHKYIADVMRSTLLTPEQADTLSNALKKKDKDETEIEYLLRKLQ